MNHKRIFILILVIFLPALVLLLDQLRSRDSIIIKMNQGLIDRLVVTGNASLMQKSGKGDKTELWTSEANDAHKNMELYLRMTTYSQILVKFYKSVLIQSMHYFWPDIASMVVVLDEEKAQDHVFGDDIGKTFPFPRQCYMNEVTVPGYSGKDRMQRDMFYPEICTSKKYVAYVDTDTMFITRIIPEMLFVENKPIIIAIYGNITNQFWNRVSQSTAKIFKTKEVMRGMANFPVIIKVDHIVKMREYLENLHNMSFDEILPKLKVHSFSQFNLMCQYIWLFHRNEYEFRFQLQTKGMPNVISGREDSKYYDKTLTTEQRKPIARWCAHYKYILRNWKNQNAYRNLLRSSICFSGGFELCPEKCTQYNKTSIRREMFEFGYMKWTWDKRCLAAQEDHYKQIVRYATTDYSDIIRKACNEVDTLTWSV